MLNDRHLLGISAAASLDLALPAKSQMGKVGWRPSLCACHIHRSPSRQIFLWRTWWIKATLQEKENRQQGQVIPLGLYSCMSRRASSGVCKGSWCTLFWWNWSQRSSRNRAEQSGQNTSRSRVSQFWNERHFSNKVFLPVLLKLTKNCKTASASTGAGISSTSFDWIWRKSLVQSSCQGLFGACSSNSKMPATRPQNCAGPCLMLSTNQLTREITSWDSTVGTWSQTRKASAVGLSAKSLGSWNRLFWAQCSFQMKTFWSLSSCATSDLVRA